MTAKRVKLSLVCPAYEEEEALPAFHQELLRAGPLQAEYDIEILYVDDGSRDGTLALLRAWAREDSRVRYLSLSRNFGHQAALTAGLEHAAGEVIITMDSDLQHPPELVPTLLAHWREGHDVVLTIRHDDQRLSLFKRLTSQWFYRVMQWFSETETRPAAADFRLMTRKAVDSLVRLRSRIASCAAWCSGWVSARPRCPTNPRSAWPGCPSTTCGACSSSPPTRSSPFPSAAAAGGVSGGRVLSRRSGPGPCRGGARPGGSDGVGRRHAGAAGGAGSGGRDHHGLAGHSWRVRRPDL